MAIEMLRSRFDQFTPLEQAAIIADGVRIVDGDEKERAERRELIQNQLARERRLRTVKRSVWDKWTETQRQEHLKASGLIED